MYFAYEHLISPYRPVALKSLFFVPNCALKCSSALRSDSGSYSDQMCSVHHKSFVIFFLGLVWRY